MALVEETARYLDGKGREEARELPRKAAMLYAGESMRVTTRLMQAASWLLVQRAVRDGDMERADAPATNAIGWASKEICLGACAEDVEPLPARCAICWSAATTSIAASRGWTISCSAKARRRQPGARGQIRLALAQALRRRSSSTATKRRAVQYAARVIATVAATCSGHAAP